MSHPPEFRLEEQACPKCGHKLDAAMAVTGQQMPEPGDYTVCLGCESVLRFGPGLKFETLAIEDVDDECRGTVENIIAAMRQVKGKAPTEQFQVTWIDQGREAKCPPDPRYPEGIDVVVPSNGRSCCTVLLPYPAKRCGYYNVMCRVCKMAALITTAGRPDDPRSVTFPCNQAKEA